MMIVGRRLAFLQSGVREAKAGPLEGLGIAGTEGSAGEPGVCTVGEIIPRTPDRQSATSAIRAPDELVNSNSEHSRRAQWLSRCAVPQHGEMTLSIWLLMF